VNADFRTKLYAMAPKSNVVRITVTFSQFASSSALTCSLFPDYATISIGGATDKLNTVINTTNFPNVVTEKKATIRKRITDLNSFYMNFRFSHAQSTDTAAIVRSIVVEPEYTYKR
jgi:hypothetical protein